MELSCNKFDITQEELYLEQEIGKLLFQLSNNLLMPLDEVQYDLQRLQSMYERLMQIRAARQ